MDIVLLYFLISYLWYPAFGDETCPMGCRCRTGRIHSLGKAYWVSCSRKNFHTIPDLSTLRSVQLPIRLDLSTNRIDVVKKTDFPPGLNVVMLMLQLNDGIRMEDSAFIHMAESLQFLNLERIHLQFEGPFTFLKGLNKLNKLVMSYNEQNEKILQRGSFSSLELMSLEELVLHSCSLAKVSDGAFQGLDSLKILHLTSNLLQAVPVAVRRLPSLRNLKLSLNKIRKIPRSSFGGLYKLEHLFLNDNEDLTLEDGAFDGLEETLQELSLRRCGFKDIPISKIAKLKKLKRLSIGDNPLTSLDKPSLNGSFCLTELDVSESFFPLDPGIFEAQGECLRGLTLNNRGLTNIPFQVFKGLKHLGEVNLKKNKIKVLPRNAFGGTPATSLSVADNPLVQIRPGAFADLRSSLSLGLENTKLTNLNFILEYEKNKFREIWFTGTNISCSCNISQILDLVEPWTLDGSCFAGGVEYILRDLEAKSKLKENCTEEVQVKYQTSYNEDVRRQAQSNVGIACDVNRGFLFISYFIFLIIIS